MQNEKATAIAAKNDEFRKATMKGIRRDNGKAVMTQGIAALGSLTVLFIQSTVAAFDKWTEGNDTYGEHDFGSFHLEGLPKIIWKIDYYADANMTEATEDKLNAYRVLIIMLAEEY